MDKESIPIESRPAAPSHKSKRTIFSLVSVLLVSGVAMILFRDREKDSQITGADVPLAAFPRWTDEDLERDEVPVTSFEPDSSRLNVWGGGVRRKEFATDGDYSFLVVFRPDDVTSSGLLCRRGTLPDLSRHGKLLMDVRARDAPFPVLLTLLAFDGQEQRRFTFPELTVPLEGSTLEFDLDSIPKTLPRSEINLLSLVTSTRPQRKLSFYVDDIRLSRGAGPVASRPTSRQPLTFDHDTNFIPDGQFDAGLALWSFRSTPAHWTVSSSADPEAPGGRTLGIHFLQAGRLELTTPELSLPPGRYNFQMALKGWEGLRWDAELVMSEDGRSWKSVRPGRDDPGIVTGRWEVLERKFVVPVSSETIFQVRIILEGRGDVHLGSVELLSLDGAVPAADYMSVYSPGEGNVGGGDTIPTWRWDATRKALQETTTGAVFPVFYLEDDFLLDGAVRRFRKRCLSIGLTAAVNLGSYLQVGDLALARQRAHRRARDGSVGAWLLTPRANWSVARVPPDLARQASEVLAGDDRRLIAIGLNTERKKEVDLLRLRSYENTADALVVAQGAGHGLSIDTQEAYDTALRAAAALDLSTPYLAFVEPGVSEKALRLQFYLALIHRAAGIVLDGGSTGTEDIPWDSLKGLHDEITSLAAEIAAGADAEITRGHPDLRLRAFTAGGKMFLLAANPGPRDLQSVQVRVGGPPVTISLGPWESKRITIDG